MNPTLKTTVGHQFQVSSFQKLCMSLPTRIVIQNAAKNDSSEYGIGGKQTSPCSEEWMDPERIVHADASCNPNEVSNSPK